MMNRSFLQIAIKIKTKQNGNPFSGSTLSAAARTLIESDVKWTAVKPRHGRSDWKPLPESVTSPLCWVFRRRDIKFKGARQVRCFHSEVKKALKQHTTKCLAGPCVLKVSHENTKGKKANRTREIFYCHSAWCHFHHHCRGGWRSIFLSDTASTKRDCFVILLFWWWWR